MKRILQFKLLVFILPLLLLHFSSCNVLNPNIMLYAEKDYAFDVLANDTTMAKEYQLAPNSIFEFRLFANDGFKLIDIITVGNGTSNNTNATLRQGFEYTIDINGKTRLPIIGEEVLGGLTTREAENLLEKRYSDFYVKPFVILKTINKRVTVYNGEPGQAKVIGLQNNNTTLLEVLALAGGISANGKAFNIKLIRKAIDNNKPAKVYKLDLSKIDLGLKQGATVVQANDIIYVEPRRQIASKILREIAPVLSITTTLITFFYLFARLP